MSREDEISPEEIIDFKTKISFGISSIGSSAVAGIYATSLIIFYRETLLLSEFYIVWAFIFYAIWNAINDPLFGWLSDRTNTRWGRRIPYLIIFSPIMAISFVFIWLSPSISEIGEFGVFLWMLLSMLCFDTGYTAALLVYSALGQELSMDHRERARLQIFAMVFGIIGTLSSLVLPMFLLDEPGSTQFIQLMLIIAIIQCVTMWITAFTIKERLEFSQDEPLSFLSSLGFTLRRKSFLITVSMNFCMIFVQSVLLGNLFFYIFYAFEGYNSTLVIILLILSLMSGIFTGIFYILRINEKKGLKTALIRALLLLGLGLIIVGALPGLFSIIGFFVVGVGLFGVMALINAAFGAVSDEDEIKTGTRREAAIFGVNAFITKPAQSVAGAFIAFILLAFHYQEPVKGVQQAQSDFTVLGLRLAIGIIPGLVVLGAALIFTLYPLHGEYLAEIQTKMYEMHDEKREKYMKKVESR